MPMGTYMLQEDHCFPLSSLRGMGMESCCVHEGKDALTRVQKPRQ
jgi:hypothetical protein